MQVQSYSAPVIGSINFFCFVLGELCTQRNEGVAICVGNERSGAGASAADGDWMAVVVGGKGWVEVSWKPLCSSQRNPGGEPTRTKESQGSPGFVPGN